MTVRRGSRQAKTKTYDKISPGPIEQLQCVAQMC